MQIYMILSCIYFLKKTFNIQKIFERKTMDQGMNSREQLKIIAQVLCKMGKFFNDMTQLCLQELTGNDSIKNKHQMLLKRQNIKNQQNNKKLENLNSKNQSKKKINSIEMIKNLKPKHPVSSFFFFYRQKGQEIAKERGEVLGSKIAKIVGELWTNMNEAQREPYEVKARETRKIYDEQMSHYKLKYANEITTFKKYKKELKEAKQKKKVTAIKPIVSESKKIQTEKDTEQKIVVNDLSSISDEDSLLDVSDEMSDSLSIKSNSSLVQRQSNSPHTDGIQVEHRLNEKAKDVNDGSIEAVIDKISKETDNLMNFFTNSKHLTQQTQKIKKEMYKSSQKVKDKDENIVQQTNSQLNEETKNQVSSESEINLKSDHFDVIQHNQNKKCQKQNNKKEVTRPKGPVSSFFMFYKTEGKRIAQENHLSLGPRTIKLASGIWKTMTSEQKKKYEQQSYKTREKYHQQMQELKKIHGDGIFDRKKTKNGSKQRKNSKKNNL